MLADRFYISRLLLLLDLASIVRHSVRMRSDELSSQQNERQISASNRAVAVASAALIVSTFTTMIGLYTALTSRDSEFRSLRAYVSVGGGNRGFIVSPLRDGLPLRAEVAIDNAGETPAFDMHVYMNIISLPSFLEPDLKKQPPLISTVGMLGKHVTIYASKNSADNDSIDERLSVRAGAKRIYVFGDITYMDTFSHRHEIQFCDFFQGGSLMEPEATTCSEHTSSD